MANFESRLLPDITGNKMESEKERRQILNYLALLDEKLRYMFGNLEPEENFSEESFQNYIKTEKNVTALQVREGEITALIDDMDGNMLLIEMDVARLQSTMTDAEGNISQLQQTAESISSRVSDAEENISIVEQEADKISWIIRSGTSSSNFTLTSRMASLVAAEIDITGFVTFNDLEGSGTTSINGDNIDTGEISAEFIHLGGYMDVFQTENSNTIGGYIGYGSGNDGRSNTSGIMMAAKGEGNYFIATNSGIRMTYEDEYAVYCTSNGVSLLGDYEFRAATNFYCLEDGAAALGTSTRHWSEVYADTGEINTSDRRKKNSVGYDLSAYEELFKLLRPTQYKMNNGKSGRYHIGFIAQDVEDAMSEVGMESTDFAGFIKSPVYEKELENGEPDTSSEVKDYNYSLRYGEFVALNTHMIQKLMEQQEKMAVKIEELENEIKRLKEG